MTKSQSSMPTDGGTWAAEGKEMRGTKGYIETFGNDGNIHYLDCGGGFMGVCNCENLPNCTR